ncbi:hypothetical protein BD626DRAFT_498053 [Schizophyllum amplum]|uniref:Uncharacterized protein n=1 Tax=Schizophyllum amplum TaxID=97359 RepID=A0A550CCX4_9AGAR|nr:hypothetical protein BD626DRAFT_498053 [Auriculariopsis ampla]
MSQGRLDAVSGLTRKSLCRFLSDDDRARSDLMELIGDLELCVNSEEEDLGLVLQAIDNELERPSIGNFHSSWRADLTTSASKSKVLDATLPTIDATEDSNDRAMHAIGAACPDSQAQTKDSYLATPLRSKYFPRLSPSTLRLLLQSPATSVESPDISIALFEDAGTKHSEISLTSSVAATVFASPTSSESSIPDVQAGPAPKPTFKPPVLMEMPLTPPPTGEMPSVARFPSPPPAPLSPASSIAATSDKPPPSPEVLQNWSPPPTPPPLTARQRRRQPLTINIAAANILRGRLPPAGLIRPFSEAARVPVSKAVPIPHVPHLSLLSPTAVSRFRRVINEMRGVDEESDGVAADGAVTADEAFVPDDAVDTNDGGDIWKNACGPGGDMQAFWKDAFASPPTVKLDFDVFTRTPPASTSPGPDESLVETSASTSPSVVSQAVRSPVAPTYSVIAPARLCIASQTLSAASALSVTALDSFPDPLPAPLRTQADTRLDKPPADTYLDSLPPSAKGYVQTDTRLRGLAHLLEERAVGDEAEAQMLFSLAERMSAMAGKRREAVSLIKTFGGGP